MSLYHKCSLYRIQEGQGARVRQSGRQLKGIPGMRRAVAFQFIRGGCKVFLVCALCILSGLFIAVIGSV